MINGRKYYVLVLKENDTIFFQTMADIQMVYKQLLSMFKTFSDIYYKRHNIKLGSGNILYNNKNLNTT